MANDICSERPTVDVPPFGGAIKLVSMRAVFHACGRVYYRRMWTCTSRIKEFGVWVVFPALTLKTARNTRSIRPTALSDSRDLPTKRTRGARRSHRRVSFRIAIALGTTKRMPPSPDQMRTLFDDAGSPSKRGPALAGMRRRERVYQMIIWVLVVWNLGLQYTRAAHGLDLSRTALPQSDPTVPAFVAPHSGVAAFGSAGVVCSGCTDDSGVPKDANESFTSYNMTVDGELNASAANSSTLGFANATSATNSSNSTTEPPPPPSSPPPPPPPPPFPKAWESQKPRLEEGAACTSTARGDSTSAGCFPFCTAKFARFHCERCKWCAAAPPHALLHVPCVH